MISFFNDSHSSFFNQKLGFMNIKRYTSHFFNHTLYLSWLQFINFETNYSNLNDKSLSEICNLTLNKRHKYKEIHNLNKIFLSITSWHNITRPHTFIFTVYPVHTKSTHWTREIHLFSWNLFNFSTNALTACDEYIVLNVGKLSTLLKEIQSNINVKNAINSFGLFKSLIASYILSVYFRCRRCRVIVHAYMYVICYNESGQFNALT